jgi:hypothetical protein
MRQVNIGFNVKTSDAVKDLKKFQGELINIQKLVTDISNTPLDIKIDKKKLKATKKFIDSTFNSNIDLGLSINKISLSNFKKEIEALKKQLVGLELKGKITPNFGIRPASTIGKLASQPSIPRAEFQRRDTVSSIDSAMASATTLRNTARNKQELDALILKLKLLRREASTIVDGSRLPTFQNELRGVTGRIRELNKTPIKPDSEGLKKSLINFDIYRRGMDLLILSIRNGVREFLKFEDAIYDLKVVGGGAIPTIENLKKDIIELSIATGEGATKFSASQIATAINDTMRMGKNYQEAIAMVAEAQKLAISSSASLSDASASLNKIMIALSIEGRNAGAVTEFLHGTAIATASSMESLSVSAKQYVGALGALQKSSSKTGQELEIYKITLMELGITFSGVLANMGREKASPYVEKSA